MWAAFDDRQRIRNEQRSKLIRLAVGIDNRNRAGPLDFDDRVVGVGQAERDLTGSGSLSHLLVATENADIVRPQVTQKLGGFLAAQSRKQTSDMGGRGACDGASQTNLSFPLRIRQVVDRGWLL